MVAVHESFTQAVDNLADLLPGMKQTKNPLIHFP